MKDFYFIIKGWSENKPIGITCIARNNKFNINIFYKSYQYYKKKKKKKWGCFFKQVTVKLSIQILTAIYSM